MGDVNPIEDELEIQYSPTPAIVGDWVIISIEKFGNNSNVKTSTDDHKFWVSLAPAFGQEIKVAFPLADSPKDAIPVGCLSLDQFQDRVLKVAVELSRFGIKLAAQPIELT